MASVGVYIIDEHEPVRRALAQRLAQSADVTIVGHAGETESALRDLRQGPADVVLVEIKRSDGMGLELVRQLAAAPNAPKLIVLTSYLTEWEEQAAHRAGASGYILKDIAPEELIQRISAVLATSA
ncbi:MAG TPA: response regulator transcription factor [Anaerolineales bacterium]|nr:response regulator transcription factor [Anaerolineales bacterium]